VKWPSTKPEDVAERKRQWKKKLDWKKKCLHDEKKRIRPAGESHLLASRSAIDIWRSRALLQSLFYDFPDVKNDDTAAAQNISLQRLLDPVPDEIRDRNKCFDGHHCDYSPYEAAIDRARTKAWDAVRKGQEEQSASSVDDGSNPNWTKTAHLKPGFVPELALRAELDEALKNDEIPHLTSQQQHEMRTK